MPYNRFLKSESVTKVLGALYKPRSHVCWQVAVEVNTTQEALCCQSSAPNQKLCQANTTCIIKVGLSYYSVLFQIFT